METTPAVTYEFKRKPSYECPQGIHELHGTAKDPSTFKTVGYISAQLVFRKKLGRNFQIELDHRSAELHELAETLFDSLGNLNSENRDCPVFGKEFSKGNFVYFASVRVDEDRRRQGVGKELVDGILGLTKDKDCPHAFVWPTALNPEVKKVADRQCLNRQDVWLSHRDIAITFWKTMGFQRVGTIPFFYRATSDDEHGLRQAPAQEDYDATDDEYGSEMAQSLRLGHHEHEPSDIPLRIFCEADDDIPVYEKLVAAKEEEMLYTDKDEHTLAHLAAWKRKPRYLRFLLQKHPELRDAKNYLNQTPLELMEIKEEEYRQDHVTWYRPSFFYEDVNRDGYLSCKALLMGAETEEEVNEIKTKYKFGCSCGNCIGGVLSYRTALKMKNEAIAASKAISEALNGWDEVKDSLTTDHTHVKVFPELAFIPPQIRKATIKDADFKVGFAAVLAIIASFLSSKTNLLPTVENITGGYFSPNDKTAPSVNHFFNEGGKLNYALDLILHRVGPEDYATRIDAPKTPSQLTDVSGVPVCSNDSYRKFLRRCVLPYVPGEEDLQGPYKADDWKSH